MAVSCMTLQDRSLQSCLNQLFSQQPSQDASALQHIRSQHSAGWHLSGAVLTAPTPALSSKPHQLLYVNSRAVACPMLAQLLRDWFIRHAKASMGGETAGNKSAGEQLLFYHIVISSCTSCLHALAHRSIMCVDTSMVAS